MDETEMTEQEVNEMRDNAPYEYRYPDAADQVHMHDKVQELKKMIASKHPEISFGEYEMLDHMNGKCDYDPYDRYDAEQVDEGASFGHLHSEDIPQERVDEFNEEPWTDPNDPTEPPYEEVDDETFYAGYDEPAYDDYGGEETGGSGGSYSDFESEDF